MSRRHGAIVLVALATLAAGCGSAPGGDSDFTDVPGIGRTRIDVPRPSSPAAVGGPTKDCASDGLPSASGSIKDRVAALRKIGFFADRKGDSDATVAADVQSDIESASGSTADAGDRMLDLMVAATDANRVWWNDLEADVGPDNAVYEETLDEWAAISKAAFAPTGIKETWGADTGPVSVSYMLDGAKQTLAPAYLDDWIDPGILATINEQIAASGRRFELYRGFDQTAYVLALTPKERTALEHDRGWCFD